MKNIIVIGSGIGGSGVGALIAANSKNKVTIFEQNAWLGGRCGSYIKSLPERARLDISPQKQGAGFARNLKSTV